MRDLLLPTTDAGVLVQLVLVVGLWASGLVWARRRPSEVRLLVLGLGIVAVGLVGLRAMH